MFSKETVLENVNHSSSLNSGNLGLTEDIHKDFGCRLFFLLVQHERFLS